MKRNISVVFASLLFFPIFSVSAGLINSDDIVTINWKADCFDCLGHKGLIGDSNEVTGNIVLSGVSGVEGDDKINFDASNIISFQYEAQSNHLDSFILYNASYSSEDVVIDQSDDLADRLGGEFNVSQIPFYIPTAEQLEAADIIDYGHEGLGEDVSGSGWFSDEGLKYQANISFSVFAPIDSEGEYIPYSNLSEGDTFNQNLFTFAINAFSDGEWDITITNNSVNDDFMPPLFLGPHDFGSGMGVTQLMVNGQPYSSSQSGQSTTQPVGSNDGGSVAVSEPTTLAIFGMALLGLVGLRKKAL